MLESLFNIIVGLKQTLRQVFFCEYCKSFKNTYFEEHLRTAASAVKSFLRIKSKLQSIPHKAKNRNMFSQFLKSFLYKKKFSYWSLEWVSLLILSNCFRPLKHFGLTIKVLHISLKSTTYFKGPYKIQKQQPELFCKKSWSYKFRNIYRKTPVLRSKRHQHRCFSLWLLPNVW